MKVVEDSPSRLVLKDRTLWITGFCFVFAGFMGYQALVQPARVNFLAPLFLILVGMAFLDMSDVVFDKTRRMVSLRRFSVVKLTRATFRFEEITDVVVQIAPLIGSSTSTQCRLAFVAGKAPLPMTISYGPNLARYEAMRASILRALGRIGEPALDDPVRDLVRQGRIVDAVAMLRKRESLDLVTARDRIMALQKEIGRG